MTNKGWKLGTIVQILKDYDILFDKINEKILFRRLGDESYTIDVTDLLFRLYDYEQQSFAYALENYSKRIEEKTLAKHFSRYYIHDCRKDVACSDSSGFFLQKDGAFAPLNKDSKSFATRFFAKLYMKTHKRLCYNCEVLFVYFGKI